MRRPAIAPAIRGRPLARLDLASVGTEFTGYERDHLVHYLHLLDAAKEGADWREVVRVLFGIDPAMDPERARLVHRRHLEGAR